MREVIQLLLCNFKNFECDLQYRKSEFIKITILMNSDSIIFFLTLNRITTVLGQTNCEHCEDPENPEGQQYWYID